MSWILVTAGRGPIECQVAVSRLVHIVVAEAEKDNLQTSVLDTLIGEHGLLSAMIAIEGAKDNKFVESWNGTIKWQCASPLRNTKRKNWFVSGNIILPPPDEMPWREDDIEFSTFRSSGPGGQHVNTTNSAVRLTHRPTGIVVEAQEERSQFRNKSLAVARLAEKFREIESLNQKKSEHEVWMQHDQVVRGNPIRTYIGLDFKKG